MFGRKPHSAFAYCLPLLLVGFAACQPSPTVEEEPAASALIPVTTSSERARELFLKGRDLNDRLRATDAHDYFLQAIELDPDFAQAHLLAANTSPSAQKFFDHLETAVATADGASDGERLLIEAASAANQGHPDEQQARLKELVAAYPDDERAHNALGGFHFGRQEYEAAIEHYQHAIDIDPEFSAPYNQKGYAHRFLGDFDAAEVAFLKYIELIPDDPNPYDSYAELLMKMGRFEDSTAKYLQALEQDSNFIASYIGIANNQMFTGDMEGARSTLKDLSAASRNVGEQRAALVWTAHSYLHEGNHDAAITVCEEMYALADAGGDTATMAGDLNLMGDMQLAAGRPEAAAESYAKSIETIETADVSDAVKENTKRNILFDEARVALAKGDEAGAGEISARYGELVAVRGIPFEVRQHHELDGMIALAGGDYAAAIAHLDQANQQNPRVLYLLAQAHAGASNSEAAAGYGRRAAHFNALSPTYSYVRAAATEMLTEL